MWVDAIDLLGFYRSPLGQIARRMVRRRIREIWPDVKGMRVMGLGYTTPYLGQFRGEAERVIAFMAAPQGVIHWPFNERNLTSLVDEAELPLPDLSVDRVLLVHCLESTDRLRQMMREIWRVLSGSGRLLIVTPNRRGIWARMERTPFGYGRPYSTNQLSKILRDNMFTPFQADSALYMPPTRSRMVQSMAPAFERFGHSMFHTFGGVSLFEASKQIYAGQAELPLQSVRRRAYLPLQQRSPKIIPRNNLRSGQ